MIPTKPTTMTTALSLFSIAVAVALLISFVRVVDDFAARGAQRQQQQRATGDWLLPDERLEPTLVPASATEPAEAEREPQVMARR